MSSAREEYERKLLGRQPAAVGSDSPVAEAAPAAPDFASASKSAGAQAATSAASQGDLAGTIGSAGMMSGNPVLAAAGLGLQVYAAGEKNKRAAQEMQRKEYNDRIMRRQQMLQQIASQGIQ